MISTPGAIISRSAAFVEIANAANRADGVEERTTLEGLRNWAGYAKVNWQATSKDMVNFLFFNGPAVTLTRTKRVYIAH